MRLILATGDFVLNGIRYNSFPLISDDFRS